MKKITKYDIAKAESLEDLSYQVNKKIEEGWQPFGQVFYLELIIGSPVYVMAQAMVFYED
jgi:hypothetical protein